MSIKFKILLLAVFACLSFHSYAQETLVERTETATETSVFADEDESVKKKDKKKKDKKEDLVTVDMQFAVNLLVNIVALILIAIFIYNRNYQKPELLFTFFAFNLVIFLLTYVMNHVKLSMGAAFGLFAVFSMLRYRTEGISPKDMTYLFIMIATGLICAIKLDFMSLLIVTSIIVLSTWLLDGNVIFKRQFSKIVTYDKIELIKPENLSALLADLKARTGLNIYKVSIDKINFLRDEAILEVYYHD